MIMMIIIIMIMMTTTPQLGVLSLLHAGRRLCKLYGLFYLRNCHNPVGKVFIPLVSVEFLKLSEDTQLILFTVPRLASGRARI